MYIHDSYFFATVHHIDEPPISWKPQIAPNKTNGKKKGEKTSDLPLWLSFSMRSLRSNQTSKVHAKVPPMPGSREVPCHLFPSEGFSRFVLDVFSWRLIRHFLKLQRIGDGVCFFNLGFVNLGWEVNEENMCLQDIDMYIQSFRMNT